jgi:hypothetical protein
MANVQNTQGGATKAPPIPSMDVTPAPTATSARQIAQEARDVARQVRTAVQDANNGTRNAAKAAQDAGHTSTTAPPPPFNSNDYIPQQAVDISVAFFVTVAICVVGFPLARALARFIDRRGEMQRVTAPDLTPHFRQLQDSVDAMAIELERISEGQRFTAKLLAERSGVASQQQ